MSRGALEGVKQRTESRDDRGISRQRLELGDDEQSGQNIDPAIYTPLTLAKQISRNGRLPGMECLKLGLALTQSLAELHKRDLVHRDIKPSNIIFVNGVPKLADIGLVAGVNEAGSLVGTQGYIPPEGPGTAQADIYSLGKVLYEAPNRSVDSKGGRRLGGRVRARGQTTTAS